MKTRGLLKKVLLGLVAIIVLLIVVVALQPGDFRVTRSATIKAPPNVVFKQVNDFHKWQAWSPRAKLDPNAQATFSGAEAGAGAQFAWAGNDKVGKGRMEIMESHPADRIKIKLEFIEPFPATNTTEFTFKPLGDATEVTWNMTGANDFMGKAFCLVMNMDKMVGGDFEKGLANMKAVAEAAQKQYTSRTTTYLIGRRQ